MNEKLSKFQEFVEQVRAASSIEEIVGQHAKLERAGSRLQCLSPFRSEKDPSFMVYPDEDRWWDFGPGDGGDVFAFIMTMDGCDFRDAVDKLAKRAGIRWEGGGKKLSEKARKEIDMMIESRRVIRIQTEIAELYHKQLPEELRSFIQKQYGLTDETINNERLGFADGDGLDTMLKKGYTEKQLLETGMFLVGRDRDIIEMHAFRITMPYWHRGQAPYMISRSHKDLPTYFPKAKYVKTLTRSTKHTYVSSHVTNSHLWGIDSASRRRKTGLICEGITDGIAAKQAGYPAISFVTTRPRKKDYDRLAKASSMFEEPVIVFDNDREKVNPKTGKASNPGLDGAIETAKVLISHDQWPLIGVLPLGEYQDATDLNEYLLLNKVSTFEREVVERAVALPTLLLEMIPIEDAENPLKIEKELYEILELLKDLPALRKETYVNQISSRLNISKFALMEMLSSLIVDQKPSQDIVDTEVKEKEDDSPKDESKASKEIYDEDKKGDGGDGDDDDVGNDDDGPSPPSLPPEEPEKEDPDLALRGVIFEAEEGYYMCATKNGEERISNFVLDPKYLVKHSDGDQLCCDLVNFNDAVTRNVLLPHTAFKSSKDLQGVLRRRKTTIAWTGTDNNVNGLVETLRKKKIPEILGVKELGFALNKDGESRWVTADGIYGPEGRIKDADLIYSPKHPSKLSENLDLRGMDLSHRDGKAVAKKILPLIWKLNRDEVILPAVCWFMASLAAPAFRDEMKEFPLLCVNGIQGSGKSSLITDALWPTFSGVQSEAGSCGTSTFARVKMLSSTSSIASFLDEYKGDLKPSQKEAVERAFRQIFKGEIERRGNPDQTVNEYRMISPLVFAGEVAPSDRALLERIIQVHPRKRELTAKRRMSMINLTRSDPSLLSGVIIRWVLKQDIKSFIARAKAVVEQTVASTGYQQEQIPPRKINTLIVLTSGHLMMQDFHAHMGVSRDIIPALSRYLRGLFSNEEGSWVAEGSKDALDGFLEDLAAYAHLGEIQEGIHYAMVDGVLRIHLRGSLHTYKKLKRSAGEVDETNGEKSLRNVAKEKMACGDTYVVSIDQRAYIGATKPKCLSISPEKLMDQIGIELPIEANRRWGGSRLSLIKNEDTNGPLGRTSN